MSDQFELHAEVREDMGKGASRRLRRLADNVSPASFTVAKTSRR